MRWLKALLLLCVHPLMLLLVFVSIDTYTNFPNEEFLLLLLRCAGGCKRALMYSVVDAMIYGNWVYPAGCTCLLPVWLQLWHVLHLSPSVVLQDKIKTN